MANWRLIINPPKSGAWNMAVDEAILESVTNLNQPPTLRLYNWQPYALSLGLAQPFSDIDIQAVTKNGWDIVRRPTGGRAILHADELTYSICAHQDDSHVSGNILESYRRLSTGLLQALETIGIIADSKLKDRTAKKQVPNPVCFQDPSDYEITYQGKKLIGSAQARRNRGVLQHGALPLTGDISRIVSVLAFPNVKAREQAKHELLQRATTTSDIIGRVVTWQEMANCMIRGFQTALNINLIHGSISLIEEKRANQLFQEKYNNDQWTKRL